MLKGFTRRVALAAMVCAIPFLAAAQLFGNFPQVGGDAYDSGSGVMVPAGPTALTGNETVAADTNLSQGRQPQTVKVALASMGAGPAVFAAPLTGVTLQHAAGDRRLILVPAGTIAALTVQFPTATALASYGGKTWGVCSTQVVTALTLTAGSGTTISTVGLITALAVPATTGAGVCYEWVYNKANTTWYRTQ